MSKNRPRFRTSELLTSLGLINRALQRDPHAWERMVYLYTPLIEYWATRRGISDVENVRQEVLTLLFKALPNFEKRHNGTFRGWIRTITNNVINKLLGKKEPIPLGTDSPVWNQNAIANSPNLGSMFETDVESCSIEDKILFRRIVDWVQANYSERQAAIFTRLVIEQRPTKEVAAEFDVTSNVIYQTKSRILASIRREFRDLV